MKRKLRVLDLFSGIGGFSLGLEMTGGFETVCFVETDPFCRAVLRKHWPRVRQFRDVRSVTAARLDFSGVSDIDVICGGFPCQPYSVAGQRKGREDDRHLWPEMCRVIAQVQPTWVIGENVTGIIPMALDSVLSDLESLQYATQSLVVPACAVDARHRRDRVWIIARSTNCRSHDRGRNCSVPDSPTLQRRAQQRNESHRNVPRHGDHAEECSVARATQQSEREQADEAYALSAGRRSRDESRNSSASLADTDGAGRCQQRRTVAVPTPFAATERSSQHVAHAACVGVEGHRTSGQQFTGSSAEEGLSGCNGPARGAAQWSPEPGVGRVVAGLPGRVHRLKSLGNAVVPQVVAEIGYAILTATERPA